MISVGFRARILIMTQLAVCMRLKLIDLLFNVIHITPINKASYLRRKSSDEGMIQGMLKLSSLLQLTATFATCLTAILSCVFQFLSDRMRTALGNICRNHILTVLRDGTTK